MGDRKRSLPWARLGDIGHAKVDAEGLPICMTQLSIMKQGLEP